MPTECNTDLFGFARVENRRVEASFDAGLATSDAGALLLGSTDQVIGLIDRFSECFEDNRSEGMIEHTVKTLVGQRVVGIAMGHEDLNDHDHLRHDPVMAVMADKLAAKRSDCAPVAGKSTLNRLELSSDTPTRYHKIIHDPSSIEALFVTLFLEAHSTPPAQIILDLDATDDPLHGDQEGRFFHGYYDCYCYLPLYIFCGHQLLVSKLRQSNMDAAAGSVDEVARLVTQIRAHWPEVRIILRADSGFARNDLMSWCEDHQVDYVFGLARNKRLVAELEPELERAQAQAEARRRPARCFKDFMWATQKSWSRRRRVIGKAEWMPGRGDKGANPRFVVTSLPRRLLRARRLYERLYCARGEMENRIKECQLDLFADRTSARSMRANQLRLWFASMAYVLLCALRRIALPYTCFAKATCGRIRRRLLKIAAVIRISVRRIKFSMASTYPYQDVFKTAHERLSTAAA